jgi:hypothetical protein
VQQAAVPTSAHSTPGLLPATDSERRDLLAELTRILFAD